MDSEWILYMCLNRKARWTSPSSLSKRSERTRQLSDWPLESPYSIICWTSFADNVSEWTNDKWLFIKGIATFHARICTLTARDWNWKRAINAQSAMTVISGRSHHRGWILVSRFGLAVRREAGKQRDLGSNPLRLSFLLRSCSLWTLSCDFVPHN